MACAQEEELQYFEALMLQCEQWGHPQAAAQFAQAALHEVEKVYADHNAPMAQQGRQQWLALRLQREDRLCTHLFVYALDAGQYSVSALADLPLFQPAWCTSHCSAGLAARSSMLATVDDVTL